MCALFEASISYNISTYVKILAIGRILRLCTYRRMLKYWPQEEFYVFVPIDVC